jgi:hypothetical protein
VSITLQDEPRIPMAKLFRDHMRADSGGDHQ